MSSLEILRATLLDAISRDVALMKSNMIFIAPNIPMQKLRNAIQSYGEGIPFDEVLLLADDTVFGSAKDGLILTVKMLAIKRGFESPKRVYFDKVNSINFAKSNIYINGTNFSDFIQINSKHLGGLADILNQHIEQIKKIAETTVVVNSRIATEDSAPTPQNERFPIQRESTSSRLKLSEFVSLSGLTSITSNTVYFPPNIPIKKINGAQSSHGGIINPSDIAILIDDTVFGSAKDGVVITNESIYIKEGSKPSRNYKLNDITSVSSNENVIFINGQNSAKMVLAAKLELGYVFATVNEYIQNSRNPKIAIQETDEFDSTEIIKICRKYTTPRIKADFDPAGPYTKPTVTPKFYVAEAISEKMLGMVKFCLSISDDDKVLAIFDLARHGDNAKNAFVVTTHGLYSKSEDDKTTTYISWGQLKKLKLINSYEGGYTCGVKFSNNIQIACTWKNGVVAPFGFELINDLIDHVGGERSNDDNNNLSASGEGGLLIQIKMSSAIQRYQHEVRR